MNAATVNADITSLLRARHTLLWIVSREEMRVERACADAGGLARYQMFTWDCATGLRRADGSLVADMRDPQAVLDYVRTTKQRAIYVLRDLHKWLDPVVLRSVRSLARELQTAKPDEARALVILTPSSEVPPELSGATVIEYPLPDRAEVSRILDDVLNALPEEIRNDATPDGTRERAIDSAMGLSAEGISNCYARSLVTSRTIDPALVMASKKQAIKANGITVYDPDPRGLDAIGGYDVLKTWAKQRALAFSKEARAYGLPAPKGALLVGPPGTGKSLTAKAFGVAFQMPVLRLDVGSTKSKFVGESEQNIRGALKVAEAMAPCVLWLDEIEKALAGATGPQGDGGVSADALGTILSWMQEKTAPVFVVATANDVRALPPELLRKGRFDEMFFIDLPTWTERVEIVKAALGQYSRTTDGIDVEALAVLTDGFTGAEIAAIVPDALFTAFADGARALSTNDLRTSAATVVPLSKTASEKLNALREWAKGRARMASTPETARASDVRSLDL
jgi:SpoVK/Ycf46/Vps4 family AAA+-type ATPase